MTHSSYRSPRMRKRTLTAMMLILLGIGGIQAIFLDQEPLWNHTGICDASGVVTLDARTFAVADDELNSLLIYNLEHSGAAIASINISSHLNVIRQSKKKKKTTIKEVDIEGAARIEDAIYWIASHGRKKSGKKARERMQLFRTRITTTDTGHSLIPDGTPYTNLISDLSSDPRYKAFSLDLAASRSPKSAGGLNIEGITDSPDGALLIGFRSPLINGHALLAPLLNPKDVLSGIAPRFGEPRLLDLDGRGIRGLASHKDSYLIIANDPEGDDHRPAIYQWDGVTSNVSLNTRLSFGSFNPEAVAIYPDDQGGRILLLSDDGTREQHAIACKDLKNTAKKQFRSVIIRDDSFTFYPEDRR